MIEREERKRKSKIMGKQERRERGMKEIMRASDRKRREKKE